MNPYTSSGSVATMTANVSGNDSLNDLGDGPRQPGDPERYPVGAVTRRLMGYVRPHRISFAASFVSAAVSVILQLYTPILIGEGIDLIVAAGPGGLRRAAAARYQTRARRGGSCGLPVAAGLLRQPPVLRDGARHARGGERQAQPHAAQLYRRPCPRRPYEPRGQRRRPGGRRPAAGLYAALYRRHHHRGHARVYALH